MKKKIIFRQALMIVITCLSVVGKSQLTQAQNISVTDFNVKEVGNEVEISWITQKSASTNYFEVEKSADGEEFKTVAIVMGPDPTKTACDCYWCVDKINAKTKVAYYRLKHIGINGATELSGIKTIRLK